MYLDLEARTKEASNQAQQSMPAIPTGYFSHQPPSHQDASSCAGSKQTSGP